MKTIKQEVRQCQQCGRATMHYKNGKKINWLLHIFLFIITAGLWIIPFIIIVFLGMNIYDSNKWVCSICGTES